jgi:hypothetical protein
LVWAIYSGLWLILGSSKSAALLNILACNAQLPAVVFSLELGELPMFERISAISAPVYAERIENTYREGGRVDWRRSGRFKNTSSIRMP